MKVSMEIDNNFGYEKITQLVDNIPLNPLKVTSTRTNLVNSTLLFFTICKKKKLHIFLDSLKIQIYILKL